MSVHKRWSQGVRCNLQGAQFLRRILFPADKHSTNPLGGGARVAARGIDGCGSSCSVALVIVRIVN